MNSRSTFFRFGHVYRVDRLVLGMFAGTMLDIWSTWVLVSGHYGVEMNGTLAALMRHSMVWIPVYLSCHPLLVPLLPEICRIPYCIYFGVAGFLFGVNNLAGILYGRYFLVDAFGFPAVEGACVLLAIAVFVWMVWSRAANAHERKRHVIAGLWWTGIFILLEVGFFLASVVVR